MNNKKYLESENNPSRKFIRHLISVPFSLILGLITIIVFLEIATINSDSYGKGMSYMIFVPVAIISVFISYFLLPIIVSSVFHKKIDPIVAVVLSGILGALLPMVAVYLFLFTFLLIYTFSK